ncbi:MAG: type III pantothenate kinase [bacterium]|nr:type III pantothenate kinase [bacterium]
MFVAISIGNSTIKFGYYTDHEPVSTYTFSHSKNFTKECVELIKNHIGQVWNFEKKVSVGIASVVPQFNTHIIQLIQSYFNGNLNITKITHDLIHRILIGYLPPSSLGIDRLLGVYEASFLVSPPLITIDMGTATTINVLNEKYEFEGGVIFPGIEISLSELKNKTAQINVATEFEPPKELIGNTTEQNLFSGVFHSQLFTIEQLILSLTEKKNTRYEIFLTGGNARFFNNRFQFNPYYVPNLVLNGIHRLCSTSS